MGGCKAYNSICRTRSIVRLTCIGCGPTNCARRTQKVGCSLRHDNATDDKNRRISLLYVDKTKNEKNKLKLIRKETQEKVNRLQMCWIKFARKQIKMTEYSAKYQRDDRDFFHTKITFNFISFLSFNFNIFIFCGYSYHSWL